MSLLKATTDDFQVTGAKLPNGTYLATVESAQAEATENGTRLTRMYGNIRTPEGAVEFAQNGSGTFRIGNRKLFARSWIDHNNEKAAEIGQREIKREAVSAGLLAKPVEGQTTELDFADWDVYANALVGRDVLVRTKIKSRNKDAKAEYENSTTTPERRAELEAEFEPQIVAWIEQK
jgi:hypothetical protein